MRSNQRTERLASLIEPHSTRLYRLAYRLTGTRADAEDLLQETITRLFEDPAPLEAAADPGPYLARVLYHRFVDDRRASARRPLTLVGDGGELDSIPEADELGPAALDDADRRAARLERALGRLSDESRRLLLLHDAEGYRLKELAAMTGLPTGTLKSRLSRARARLRELLWDLPEADRTEGDAESGGKKVEPVRLRQRVGE